MATIKYWDGSAWQYAVVGKQGPVGPTGPTGPAGQASLQRFRYVATGGQTSVSGTDANGNTLAYTPGLEEVFINGAAQVRGQDYTATNGTSITGITALIAGDVVEIYAWGVFNVANTISNTLIDAKGDILAGTGADSVGRLAVGANDTVLTADSSTATGLKWAAVNAGAWTQIATTTLATKTEIEFTSIPGTYKMLWLQIRDAYDTGGVGNVRLQFNGLTTNNYNQTVLRSGAATNLNTSGVGSWDFGKSPTAATDTFYGDIYLPNYSNSDSFKTIYGNILNDNVQQHWIVGVNSANASRDNALTSLRLFNIGETFEGGTVTLWGLN